MPAMLIPDTAPPKRIVMASSIEASLVDPGLPNATLPVIEVMVNGRGPFRFGVETGSPFIAAREGFGAKAGLVSAGETAGIPSYRVDSITFGGASFQDFQIAEMGRAATGV